MLHTYQSAKYHSYKTTWVYAWSALIFVAGYSLRAYGAFHFGNINVYIASLVLLYAAPPVYELGNYIVLSRCLRHIPHLSPLHPDRTLTLFLGLSIVIEVLTANGAVKTVTGDSQASIDVGKALLKTTLVLQLAVMVLLLAIAGTYHRRCRRAGIFRSNSGTADVENVLLTMYGSCTLITIRTVFRTAEYFAVASLRPPFRNLTDLSPLVRYEWFFWVFESAVMLVNSLLLNARHPGRYLPRRHDVFLLPDGRERVGVEVSDRRPVWQKCCDPFDLYGFVMGKDEKWWLKEDASGHTTELAAADGGEKGSGGV